MQLTNENVIALCALLVTMVTGFATLTFWSGVLTQRVRDLTKRMDKHDDHDKSETGMAVQIGVLTERVDAMKTGQDRLDLHMQGVQRSLANMTSRGNAFQRFEQDSER